MEHSGTHIDALCHQASNMTLCGGIAVDAQSQTPHGFSRHGVETIPPIVAPGILLDLAAHHKRPALPAGYAVTAAELEACCAANRLTIEPGAVVLVYTGNEQHWGDTEAYLAGPGMAADASRWLAERQVAAVGADNMAWDVIGLHDPELGCTLPGHVILLVQSGIYIIENLRLSELARSQVYRFTFVCTPLKFVGATGSPVRPIALAPAHTADG
jgi:kynurenine formamidase